LEIECLTVGIETSENVRIAGKGLLLNMRLKTKFKSYAVTALTIWLRWKSESKPKKRAKDVKEKD